MTTPPVARPPTLPRRSSGVERRSSDIERNRVPGSVGFLTGLSDVAGPAVDGQHYVYDKASGFMVPVSRQLSFTQAGAVTVATAPTVDLLWSGVVAAFRVRLGTAGSTLTTVTCALNGLVVATCTVAANALTAEVTAAGGDFVARTVAALVDRITLAITVAGTGAQNLSGFVAI